METPHINVFELSIENRRIMSVSDFFTRKKLLNFNWPLTSGQYKIYVLIDCSDVLYIGTTKQSIKNRLRSGLSAEIYSYKWNSHEVVNLVVWCFEELDKDQIENIEAEMAFLVRRDMGKWPLCQNEIHFNNKYEDGKLIAEVLYQQLLITIGDSGFNPTVCELTGQVGCR